MARPYEFGVMPIELDDINTTLDLHGYLTDTTIRRIVHHYGNFSHTARITFVNPTWLTAWELGGFIISPHPLFLTAPSPSGQRPMGLAIPYNESANHWSVIYVNFEARGAVYFNSMAGWGHGRAEKVMNKFFQTFEAHFQRGGAFRFEVDELCAKQGDGDSCGIYAVRNLLDLLDHRRPDSKALSFEQKSNFRANAGKFLIDNYEEREPYSRPTSEAMAAWEKVTAKKKVRFFV